MTWGEKEKVALAAIKEWEKTLATYERNNHGQTVCSRWVEESFTRLPAKRQEQFFQKLDNWVFQLYSFIQSTPHYDEARDHVLTAGRTFDPSIQSIPDMEKLPIDQLQLLVKQHLSSHRVYALIQGGMTGTGKPLAITTDIPILIAIHLRSILICAMIYGINVQSPVEIITSLKIFYAATQPKYRMLHGWNDLLAEMEKMGDYFYVGSERLSSSSCLHETLKQLLKLLFVIRLKQSKLGRFFPLLPIGVSAGVNYQLTRKITIFADKYYQLRYLLNKKGALL